MPSLPLPLPFGLASPDPCVQSADDVLSVYPRDYRVPTEHPVIDAINAAHAGAHQSYTEASDYAAAQSDILTATGEYLDGILGDHGCIRAPGELDEDYRARGLAWVGVVSPVAVMGIVNAILAPYTTAQAQYCESIADRWYVEDGTAVWGSFVADCATLVGPSYLDRLYPDDAAANDGVYRPQSDPGEPLIFTDDLGRCFLLRIPALSDANGPTAYATDGTGGDLAEMFVEDGTATAEMTFASADYLLADETYQAIVNAVDRIKGQGIRWVIVVDDRLE